MQNYKKADVKANKPGYKAVGYLALKSWFTTLAAPNPAGVGDLTERIVTDHAFSAGTGFVELIQVRKKNTGKGESKGEGGSTWMDWTYTLVIPGDGPKIQKLIDEFRNEEVILLMKDATCSIGQVIQLGDACDPAIITKVTVDPGTLRGDTEKNWMLELESGSRAFYEGTIAIYP